MSVITLGDDPFSTYATFFKKLIFLTSRHADIRVCNRGKKCWFFGKLSVRT